MQGCDLRQGRLLNVSSHEQHQHQQSPPEARGGVHNRGLRDAQTWRHPKGKAKEQRDPEESAKHRSVRRNISTAGTLDVFVFC